MSKLYQLSLDIFSVLHRHCRQYQEKIVDFYDNGRPRFAWEKIRQDYILQLNNRLGEICAPCPLNLEQLPEGCKLVTNDFFAFLNAVKATEKPSLFLDYNWDKAQIPFKEIPPFIEELEKISFALQNVSWCGAQVFNYGQPQNVMRLGESLPKIYLWEGNPYPNYFFTDQVHMLGISREGLILKEIGSGSESFYQQIFRQGPEVFAKTLEGRTERIGDPSLPPLTWEEEPAQISELRLVNSPANLTFVSLLKTLLIFAHNALTHRTGIMIREFI